MKNAWTGGQYSLFRFVFGLYLCVHFALLVPSGAEAFSNAAGARGWPGSLLRAFPNVFTTWDAPLFVTSVLVICALLSVLLMVGYKDRWAALALCYVWACFFTVSSYPRLPYAGLLLMLHALLPRAPYGSWEARGRTDPDGGWKLPPALFGVVWIALALGYAFNGLKMLASPIWRDGTALEQLLSSSSARPGGLSPMLAELPPSLLHGATWTVLALQLGFVVLVLFKRLRPIAWTLLFALSLGTLLAIDVTNLIVGLALLHLLAFDPAWIPARAAGEAKLMPKLMTEPVTETVFYDGACGLCHRTVRLILAEDRRAAFRFAPLQGEAFAQALPSGDRAQLPDSLIVHRADGTLLMRSSGIAHILIGLGGVWGVMGRALRVVPRPLRDIGYDLVAAFRKRLFAQPADVCPLLPEHLRERFRF